MKPFTTYTTKQKKEPELVTVLETDTPTTSAGNPTTSADNPTTSASETKTDNVLSKFEKIIDWLNKPSDFIADQTKQHSLKTLREEMKITDFMDVASNTTYKWNLIKKPLDFEAPAIVLTQYEVTSNALWAQLQSIMGKVTNFGGNLIKHNLYSFNPYSFTYPAEPTEAVIKLPYLSDYLQTSNAEWAVNEFAQMGMQTVANIASFTNIAPNIVINAPKVWKGSSGEQYGVKFCLFNTGAEPDTWLAHHKFIKFLRLSVLHNQSTFVTANPPAIYTVNIPGIKYSPASHIKKLTITMLGNQSLLSSLNEAKKIMTGKVHPLPEGDIIIPDAYAVSILIEDLIPQSRQILFGGDKYSAISTFAEFMKIEDSEE